MSAVVEMWQEKDGHWWWKYRQDGAELPSNRPYESQDAARDAASIAYPGVPIDEHVTPSTKKLIGLSIAGIILLLLILVLRSRSKD